MWSRCVEHSRRVVKRWWQYIRSVLLEVMVVKEKRGTGESKGEGGLFIRVFGSQRDERGSWNGKWKRRMRSRKRGEHTDVAGRKGRPDEVRKGWVYCKSKLNQEGKDCVSVGSMFC